MDRSDLIGMAAAGVVGVGAWWYVTSPGSPEEAAVGVFCADFAAEVRDMRDAEYSEYRDELARGDVRSAAAAARRLAARYVQVADALPTAMTVDRVRAHSSACADLLAGFQKDLPRHAAVTSLEQEGSVWLD